MEGDNQVRSGFNFNKIFEYCLFGLVFLLPVVFWPITGVSLFSVKVVVLVVAVVLLLATFLALTLSDGRIMLPKAKFLIPAVLFPIVAIAASFFSGQFTKSFAGQVFEVGTSGSLVLFSLLMLLSMLAVAREARVGMRTLYAFVISALVVILHLLIRLLAGVLPTMLTSRIPNYLLGGAVDTAIFLGVLVILALSALNMLSLGNGLRYFLYALMIVSLVFIGASGFLPVILVLGIFALIYFVYTFAWSVSGDAAMQKGQALFPSLSVLAISVIFLLSGGGLSGFLANIVKFNDVEVRPNVAITLSLVKSAWQQNPIIGVGPNMFKELWDLKRPVDINATQFWGTDFNFGSGFVPTLFATTGPLGGLMLLAFLVLYLVTGFRSMFSFGADTRFRYLSSTGFFISLFLWIAAFVYVPSITLLTLTFVFTGLFAGTLVSQGVVQSFEVNIFKNPKANFASVFLIVVCLIATIALGYYVSERAVAMTLFGRGDVVKAIQLNPTDAYWRGFAETSLSQIDNVIAAAGSPEKLTQAQRSEIQSLIGSSIDGVRQAIAWNSKDYQNWFALGRIYEVLSANGIEGASENAKMAYQEAEKRSPLNPAIPLALGRVAVYGKDLKTAREEIGKAIALKNNYTDAYFTLAQIEAADNNITGAIQSVEAAAFLDPQNTALYFQLGLLKYDNKDYQGAVEALSHAVELLPDYANARYFLGLAYDRLGDTANALAQFEAIQKTNPDNAEVALIVKNLEAGRSPFESAKPPVDNKPEKRANPPVKEN